MSSFIDATAVTLTEKTDRDCDFDVTLDAQWSTEKLHGGYLLAVLGRAATETPGAGHPHVSSISATFVRPPRPGAATVTAELLRAGRGSTFLRASLKQDGQSCVEALVTLGALGDEQSWTRHGPVELPPAQDCFLVPPDPPGTRTRIPLLEVVEERLDPAVLGFAAGKPSRRGLIQGWQQLADGSDWDHLGLLVALDQAPAVSFDLGLPGWSPTVQFTAYLRHVPAPGPLRVQVLATAVSGDRMDQVATAWDSQGRLVAQSTQLTVVTPV